jgi:hypothetical protein
MEQFPNVLSAAGSDALVDRIVAGLITKVETAGIEPASAVA